MITKGLFVLVVLSSGCLCKKPPPPTTAPPTTPTTTAPPTPIPRYSHMRYLFQEAAAKAEMLIAVHSPTEYNLPSAKRDYIILLGVLDELSQRMSQSCLGDVFGSEYYSVVDEVVPKAWSHPASIVKHYEEQLDAVKTIIRPIIDLIENTCGKIDTGAKTGALSCDEIVHSKVVTEPKTYQQGAKLLEALAEAGQVYLDDPRSELADRHSVITFLLTEKEAMRPLAGAVSMVKRQLDVRFRTC